ncbi:hypothetical protein BJ742DRAFT_864654 [Cladochytrium replicatum]|nr:hypothetical protein BJ742DRAFT_864654 [Cladochytrium replicatum]
MSATDSSSLKLRQGGKAKRPAKGKKAEYFMNELNKHLGDIKKGKKNKECECYLDELVLEDEAKDWDNNDLLAGLKGRKFVKTLLRWLKRMRIEMDLFARIIKILCSCRKFVDGQ